MIVSKFTLFWVLHLFSIFILGTTFVCLFCILDLSVTCFVWPPEQDGVMSRLKRCFSVTHSVYRTINICVCINVYTYLKYIYTRIEYMIVEPCIFISVGLFRKISQVPIFRLRVLGPIESTDLRAANWSWRLWAMEQCCKP